ncbi:hypothetical protein, partial [Zavarzinella formosa]|uniref:hypothetical protein n=1 Tax=Zavarzinella formosa TaxID=360055 RepID=UPI001EE66A6F
MPDWPKSGWIMPKSCGRLGVIPEEFEWVVFKKRPKNDHFWASNGRKQPKNDRKTTAEGLFEHLFFGFSTKYSVQNRLKLANWGRLLHGLLKGGKGRSIKAPRGGDQAAPIDVPATGAENA